MSLLLVKTNIRRCSTVVVCQAPVRQDSGSIPPWDLFFALSSLAHDSAGNAQIGLKLLWHAEHDADVKKVSALEQVGHRRRLWLITRPEMLRLAWNSVREGTLTRWTRWRSQKCSSSRTSRSPASSWAHNSTGNAQIGLKLGTGKYFAVTVPCTYTNIRRPCGQWEVEEITGRIVLRTNYFSFRLFGSTLAKLPATQG